MLKQIKMQANTMYSDKGIVGLTLGFITTAITSIWMSMVTPINTMLIFGITRQDISFFVTIIAGIATAIAAIIKSARDIKEGRLRPFWKKKRKS